MRDGTFVQRATQRDMLRQVPVYGILARGMSVVTIAGGIDLSVGSILGLCAVQRRAERQCAAKFLSSCSTGALSATFEYSTGGREAVATAMEILNGRDVPKEITLPSRVFTRDNVDKGGGWLEE